MLTQIIHMGCWLRSSISFAREMVKDSRLLSDSSERGKDAGCTTLPRGWSSSGWSCTYMVELRQNKRHTHSYEYNAKKWWSKNFYPFLCLNHITSSHLALLQQKFCQLEIKDWVFLAQKPGNPHTSLWCALHVKSVRQTDTDRRSEFYTLSPVCTVPATPVHPKQCVCLRSFWYCCNHSTETQTWQEPLSCPQPSRR